MNESEMDVISLLSKDKNATGEDPTAEAEISEYVHLIHH